MRCVPILQISIKYRHYSDTVLHIPSTAITLLSLLLLLLLLFLLILLLFTNTTTTLLLLLHYYHYHQLRIRREIRTGIVNGTEKQPCNVEERGVVIQRSTSSTGIFIYLYIDFIKYIIFLCGSSLYPFHPCQPTHLLTHSPIHLSIHLLAQPSTRFTF